MSYRAVVIGATGAVGGALVRELLASSACAGVVALTRRTADGLPSSSKLAVHVVQFDALQERTAELAAGCEVAFCTMGIGQPRKAAFDEFWKVDVEYAGAFARGAAAAGVRHISLLSSIGTNASSRNPYLRVKGAAEQIVAGAGIARTSLFRPSLLVTTEIRYGLQDRLTQGLFPFIAPLLPNRYHQIRVEDLARAMCVNAERPGPPDSGPYVASGFPPPLRPSSAELRRGQAVAGSAKAGSRTVVPGVEVLEYPDFMRLLSES